MTAAVSVAPQQVEIDGCAIGYRRAGTGRPLLYLHGALGVPGWAPWMEQLAGSYDLIVPDHPGWGTSATPAWFDNVHDLAYFYLDFLKALNLRDVHLAGHSIGGWIACEIAVRNTAALASLTLVAPAGLRAPGVQKFDIFLASRETAMRAAYHDPSFAERALAETPDDAQMDVILRNRYATARVGWQPRLYDPHLHKWLHRIDVPTLVMWGAEDRIIPVAHAREFVTRIPGARESIVPACGHIPQIERPDAFVERIAGFLGEVPS